MAERLTIEARGDKWRQPTIDFELDGEGGLEIDLDPDTINDHGQSDSLARARLTREEVERLRIWLCGGPNPGPG